MGSDRFQCYAQATKAALLAHGFKLDEPPVRSGPKQPIINKDWSTLIDTPQQVNPMAPHPEHFNFEHGTSKYSGYGRYNNRRPNYPRGGRPHGARTGGRGIRGTRMTTQSEGSTRMTTHSGRGGPSYQDYRTKGQLFPSPKQSGPDQFTSGQKEFG